MVRFNGILNRFRGFVAVLLQHTYYNMQGLIFVHGKVVEAHVSSR